MKLSQKFADTIRHGLRGDSPEKCPLGHAPASTMAFLACVGCNTFKWNGVDMCGKVCDVSILQVKQPNGSYGPKTVHACTRKRGHYGDCKAEPLTNPDRTPRKSYVPE